MSIYFQLIRGLKYFAERSYEDTMRVEMIRAFRVKVRGRLNLFFRNKPRGIRDSIPLRCGLAPSHHGWPFLTGMAFAGYSFPQLRLVGHAISGNCHTATLP